MENKLEFLNDYELIFSKRINNDNTKEYLSDSIENKCRFCGKSYPEVSFKYDAHTIPCFMGNKNLLSNYECDTCNKHYFNLFENEMANFMSPFNPLFGPKNRNNRIPKYKQKGQPIISQSSPNSISVSNIPDSIIDISKDNRLKFPVRVPTYIPEFVYRCLIKIGLSIMPEEIFTTYFDTKRWLMNLSLSSNIKPFMVFSTYPSSIQMNDIACLIFERKSDCFKNVPYSILFLSYANYAFQTCIPYCAKEIVNVNIQAIPFICPTSLDFNLANEETRTFALIDLSSRGKKSDDIVEISITGERQIDIPQSKF